MTFYNEDRTRAQHYQELRELEQLLGQLKPGETRVRIAEYARKQQRSVGTYIAYHAEKDFPFEVFIDGRSDFFRGGQLTIISEGERR